LSLAEARRVAASKKSKKGDPKEAGDAPMKGEVISRTMAGVGLTRDEVEKYAALGMNLTQIGAMFGITPEAMRLQIGRHAELRDSYYKGRARGVAVVASRLLRNIDDGNVAAQIFYLKNQAGWADDWANRKPDVISGENTESDETSDRSRYGVLLLPATDASGDSWEKRARDYYSGLASDSGGGTRARDDKSGS